MDLPLPLYLSGIAARTLIILAALVIGIRIFGKRNLGGLNLLDIVVVALLGNAVQNALTQGSGALPVAFVSAGILLLADRFLGELFSAQPAFERKLYGEPRVLIANGVLDQRAMEEEGIDEDEVTAAARETGLHDLSQVRAAVLEDDGTISIVPKDDGT